MKKIVFKTLRAFFLFPAAFLWEWIYRARRFAYNYKLLNQAKFKVPIISIGNITFGGTGKTPFSRWLAAYFESLDKKVLVLTRGYRGRLENGKGILRSGVRMRYNPVLFGDEAWLLARDMKNTSVVVGKNRKENLEYYFDSENPDIVLLDDGHQHLKLCRNFNIVLFDALMSIKKYKVAPRGYLREGMTSLKDADAIVITRSDQVTTEKINLLKKMIGRYVGKDVPFVELSYRPIGLYNGNFQQVASIDELKDKKVVCFSGIASPLSFFSLVESLGTVIVEKKSFPDHHFYKKTEIDSLSKIAYEHQAILITTEKDIVKIRRVTEDEHIMYLQIVPCFFKGEEELKERILKKI